MKKKCEGCRALNNGSCDLGYKVGHDYKQNYFTSLVMYNSFPLEECEKPTTIKQYIELRELKKQQHGSH